jgi:hypothetical protein
MTLEWLDQARYADTHGFNNDSLRHMWRWRDWVIEAFNDNKPYDRFITEQLAGDLLTKPTLDQRIATGFTRNQVLNSEGGIIPEEYRVEYVVDRTTTAGTVFLGLTLQCARCHDHKYDPLTQKEFYQLSAFFNQLQEKGEIPRTVDPDPLLKAPTREQQAELASLKDQIDSLEKTKQARIEFAKQKGAELEAKLAAEAAKLPKPPADGLTFHLPCDETPTTLKVSGKVEVATGHVGGGLKFDGASFISAGDVASFDRADKFSYGAWVLPETTEGMAIIARMDEASASRGFDIILSGGKVEAHLINTWPANAVKIASKEPIKSGAWHHLFVTYDGSSKAAGLKLYVDGKPVAVDATHDVLSATIKPGVPLLVGRRSEHLPFKGTIDDVRVYSRELTAAEVQTLAIDTGISEILAIAADKRTPAQREMLRDYYLRTADTEYRDAAAKIDAARKRESEVNASVPTVMVMQDMNPPRDTFVLTRGAYDAHGEKVQAGVPSFLPPMPPGAPANRFGLAQWFTEPNHPLTSRVAVNRYWYQYFGVGIVKTLEDWGLQGEQPSHPELLDWLAAHFMETKWDVKALQKLIVTSATYRQAARYDDPALMERDPENRLLARGPRMRLSAEMIRDNALAVSGLLAQKRGGPSVMPYQPAGLWEDVVVGADLPGTKYTQGHGEDLFRRSMYTFWKRTLPPAALNTFDAPDREFCTIRRPQTNTPLQALVLLNDPTYTEAARKLAERMMTEGGVSSDERIAFAFKLATARGPSIDEAKVLRETFDRRWVYFRANPEAAKKLVSIGESPRNDKLDVAELAAHTTVASMVLNLDETITK